MEERTYGWKDEQKDGRKDRRTNGRMNGETDRRMDDWSEGRMDGQTNERADRMVTTSKMAATSRILIMNATKIGNRTRDYVL